MRFRIIIITTLMLIPGAIECAAMTNDSLMIKLISIERKIMENHHDSTVVASLLYEKAMLLKQSGDFHSALATMNRIDNTNITDSARCACNYQEALMAYLTTDFSAALQDIWNFQECTSVGEEAELLYLMVLLENERWDDFRTAFMEGYAPLEDTATFTNDFRDPVLLDPLSFRRKYILPGAALFKLGYPRKAVTNITLQAIFLGFAAFEIYSGVYSTGLFSGIRPARRFYVGGRSLAEALARQRNAERILQVKKQGYQYLSIRYANKSR